MAKTGRQVPPHGLQTEAKATKQQDPFTQQPQVPFRKKGSTDGSQIMPMFVFS